MICCYILQEFRYGKETVQTTNKLTGKNCKYPWKSGVCGLKTLTALVKVNLCYGNIVWQESAGRGFKSLRDHNIMTMVSRFGWHLGSPNKKADSSVANVCRGVWKRLAS